MISYYVNLDIDTIPGYQENDINSPAGWDDFKTIKDSLVGIDDDITWYFKGIRSDISYVFRVSNLSHTILKWPSETEPWRLKI